MFVLLFMYEKQENSYYYNYYYHLFFYSLCSSIVTNSIKPGSLLQVVVSESGSMRTSRMHPSPVIALSHIDPIISAGLRGVPTIEERSGYFVQHVVV